MKFHINNSNGDSIFQGHLVKEVLKLTTKEITNRLQLLHLCTTARDYNSISINVKLMFQLTPNIHIHTAVTHPFLIKQE
jgi:hypothetical protein